MNLRSANTEVTATLKALSFIRKAKPLPLEYHVASRFPYWIACKLFDRPGKWFAAVREWFMLFDSVRILGGEAPVSRFAEIAVLAVYTQAI